MVEVTIYAETGGALDARVEIKGGHIIIHSRSGAGVSARNPHYRPALEAILEKLSASGIKPDVYLDSRPVQKMPLTERLIANGSELTGPVTEQFNFLVRAMNAGTDSHGAWRRILLDVAGHSTQDILKLLKSDTGSAVTGAGPTRGHNAPVERLPAIKQRMVTSSHINGAVEEMLAGNSMSQFSASRDYDVITPDGDRLAPKKVFGRALELAGVVSKAMPKHFSAGWGQPSFELLESAGLSVVRKSEAAAVAKRRKGKTAQSRKEAQKLADSVGADSEERAWIEGDKRMVGHLRIERKRSAQAASAKRAAVRSANDGKLACERCGTDWYQVYPPQVAEAVFDVHHTIPLAQMSDGHETTVDDLLCLCANCHRAEHRKMALGL